MRIVIKITLECPSAEAGGCHVAGLPFEIGNVGETMVVQSTGVVRMHCNKCCCLYGYR